VFLKKGCARGQDGPDDILSAEVHDRIMDVVYPVPQPEVGRVAHPQDVGRDGLVEPDHIHEFRQGRIGVVDEARHPVNRGGKGRKLGD
jgi:hypothetical protein